MTVSSDGNTQNALLAWLEGRFPLVGGVKAGLIGAGVAVLIFSLLTVVLVFLQLQPALAGCVGVRLRACRSLRRGRPLWRARSMVSYNDRFLLAMEDLQRMVRFGIPHHAGTQLRLRGRAASLAGVDAATSCWDSGLGVPLEQAMAREAHRVRVGELAMLAAILSTQASTGGNLSESVGNLATMLRERREQPCQDARHNGGIACDAGDPCAGAGGYGGPAVADAGRKR